MNLEETLKIKIADSLKSEGIVLDVKDIIIEKSKTPEHGDYASNVALKFAGRFSLAPRDLAQKIANNIDKELVEKVISDNDSSIKSLSIKDLKSILSM